MFDLSMPPPILPGDARACVDELTEIEQLKSHLCARQARLTSLLDDLTPTASDRGTAAQVGLARRESPHRGRMLLGLSRALEEMPCLMAALESGRLNERRAEIIAREGQDLSYDDRLAYDSELAGDPSTLAGLGDHEVLLAAQRVVLRLDEAGALRRRERAHGRRKVTCRRLGDGQSQVTGVVADHQAAGIMAALHEHAAQVLARGQAMAEHTGEQHGEDYAEDRSRAQIIADEFVARLTGVATGVGVPVRLDLVISAESLFGDGDEPADIPGCGPVPASVARKLALASPEQATTVRRLFADTDHLVAMESIGRAFTGLLRDFVHLRDQLCRTPYCGARVLQLDHVTAVAEGGPTTALNAQGLCVSCNQTKEEPGWRHHVSSGPVERHRTTITTPTGHTHTSQAPPTPAVPPPRDPDQPQTCPAGWRWLQPGVWVPEAA